MSSQKLTCGEGGDGIQINPGPINVTTFLLCLQGMQEMGGLGVRDREAEKNRGIAKY